MHADRDAPLTRPRAFPLVFEDPRGHAIAIGGSLLLGFITAVASAGFFSITWVSPTRFVRLVAFFFEGGPKEIEVRPDALVLRYWARHERIIAASRVHLQLLPNEIVVHDGKETYSFEDYLFPGGSLDECARAIERIAVDVVERRAR
jgi:hypothetical protein